MKAHLCTGCGEMHTSQDAHKEHLTKIKCEMLKKAALYVKFTGVNNFRKRDVPGMSENSAYGNFQKLRYHGLIVQIRENGVKSRDHWLITQVGWKFLRGEVVLPKFVLVKDNQTLQGGRSETLVTFLDVLKVGEYLETSFEYFDHDTGAMVGKRPAAPITILEQAKLV
jgi:hypothetical protein